METTVADLRRGQKGIIKEFTEDFLPIKLLELGCLPGNLVELGSHIAIRREMALHIALEIIEDNAIV